MAENQDVVSRVRAGRMAGLTMIEIAKDMGVSYGVVSGTIQRHNIGLPEEAREAIELARRAKCRELYRARYAEHLGFKIKAGNISRPSPMDEDGFVFDIESRSDAWDEVGGAYMAQDESY